MLKRIVVPLDGSPHAERALPVAACLARASGGSVVLLQVVNPPMDYGLSLTQPSVMTEHDIAASLTQADHYLAGLAQSDEREGIGIQVEALSGAVVPTLFTYVQSCGADLIVLCSHGYSGLKRWVLGSVADQLTHHSPVPVLVLRDGGPLPITSHPAIGRPLRALVVLDGSTLAEAALAPAVDLVAALAAPAQGELHLVRVVAILPRFGSGKSQANSGMEMMEQAKHEAQAYLISVVDQLQTGIAAKLHLSTNSVLVISDADVAGAIIRAGESVEDDEGYAFMALATHGRGGLERWAMGSITERVLHGTRLPLLIVRPGTAPTKKEGTGDEIGALVRSEGQGRLVCSNEKGTQAC